MFEIDALAIFTIFATVVMVWFVVFQFAIPLYKKEPLFPAFRHKAALIVTRQHEEQLLREIQLVQEEERQAELERELFNRKQDVKTKREPDPKSEGA